MSTYNWIKVRVQTNLYPIDPEDDTIKRFIRRLHYTIYNNENTDISTYIIYKHESIPYSIRILGITAKSEVNIGLGILSYLLSHTKIEDDRLSDDLNIDLGIFNPAYYDLSHTTTKTYTDVVGDDWSTIGIIQNIQDYNVSYIPVDTRIDNRFYAYHY